MADVLGHLKALSEGRIVFLGQKQGDESYYAAFRNKEGEDTYLCFSPEAMAALVDLCWPT